MGSKGREPDKLTPFLDEIAKEANREPPMSDGDATGHVPYARHKRHIATEAWKAIKQHDSTQPLPGWVFDYLKDVAIRIENESGPLGALSREGASIALGIDGKAWSQHSPINVYHAMQEWIDDPHIAEITGPKSAAAKYIEELMSGDREAKVATVVRKYKEGKHLWFSED